LAGSGTLRYLDQCDTENGQGPFPKKGVYLYVDQERGTGAVRKRAARLL